MTIQAYRWAYPVAAVEPATAVSISGEQFLVNGTVTNSGRTAVALNTTGTVSLEGLLLNARMVNAIFDDENATTVDNWDYPSGPAEAWDPDRNVAEFLARVDEYASYGLNAVTVSMQGGNPAHSTATGNGNEASWIVSGFNSDGSLKAAWMDRLSQVIEACDAAGMVVTVQMFYARQELRLANQTAIENAVDELTDWIMETKGYTNVMLVIQNETGISQFEEHTIFLGANMHALIERAKTRHPTLLVGIEPVAASNPTAAQVTAADFVALHGNGLTETQMDDRVDAVREMAAWIADPKPITFTEDDVASAARMDNALREGCGYGFFDPGYSAGSPFGNYTDGFQSVPCQWQINTAKKQEFFDQVAEYAGVTP